jgi:mannosyltransferase OCH1-like enzyme
MSDLYTIPNRLPPRNGEAYDQCVPKIIWQTMKANSVPKIMKDYSDSWIGLNPEYEYRFFDDQDIARFIATEFPEFIAVFNKIKQGAVKADLWRYLILYKFGGVYADMDCRCIAPLRKWIQPGANWVTQLGINRDVCQWLIITVPGNPVLKKAAEKSKGNLIHAKEYGEYQGFYVGADQRMELCKSVDPIRSYHPIMKLAGPPVLQEAAEECFLDPSCAALFKSTQIVCISGKVSCQMNGNVQHEYRNQEYIQALEKLSTPHYDSSPGKIALFKYFMIGLLRRVKNKFRFMER